MTFRSHLFRWGPLVLGTGIFTWAVSLSDFMFPPGAGWSVGLLFFCVGIYLFIVVFFVILEGLAVQVQLLPSADDISVRSQIYRLGIGLVAVSIGFLIAINVWRPLFDPYSVSRPFQNFEQNLILPLIILGISLIIRSIGVFVNRLGYARPGMHFLVLAGLGMLFVRVIYVPTAWLDEASLREMMSFTGDQPTPKHNIVTLKVEESETGWAAQVVRFVVRQQPKHTLVLAPLTWDMMDSLGRLVKEGNQIIVGMPPFADVKDIIEFSRTHPEIDFAVQTSIPGVFVPKSEGGKPDVAVRLAQVRGVSEKQIADEVAKASGGLDWVLINPYTLRSWRSEIPVAVASRSVSTTWEIVTPVGRHFNFGHARFTIDQRQRKVVGRREDELLLEKVFQNRTVIIDFISPIWRTEAGLTQGQVIGSAVLNIEHGHLPKRVSPVASTVFFLSFLVMNMICYYRLRPMKALGIVMLFNAIVFAVLIILFFEAHVVIIRLLFLGVSAVLLSLVLFPYELARERAGILGERSRLSAELKAAREMQIGLMPKADPEVKGFDISGVCQPANEVGGDFFDYLWLDKKRTRLGIAVADVSGKAMRAAITAVMTSGMIYRELGENGSPKAILRKINKPMYTKLDSRMFTALSFAVIDVKKKILRFSNAGQVYPLLKREGKVIPLEVKGARLPLGVKEDVAYGEMTVKLRRGDVVVFYTDGIPEAMNKQEEFYGFERFKALVQSTNDSSSQQIRDRIVAEVREFTGGVTQHDDMTVVIVKALS